MLSPSEKRALLERLDALARAVKQARQRANDAEASTARLAERVFGFIHLRE